MIIVLTRGNLFQMSQSVQKIAPAKPMHAERFRRAADGIIKRAKRIDKEHKAECAADEALVPADKLTQEKIKEIREARAETQIQIDIDPLDLQVLTAAYINFWSMPVAQGSPLGMPWELLSPLAEDLKVLGVWEPWKLGEKLIVEDKELETSLPLGAIETVPLAEVFPLAALGEAAAAATSTDGEAAPAAPAAGDVSAPPPAA